MSNSNLKNSLPRDHARAWLTRRDAGWTPQEAADFARWRAADPLHEEAVVELESTWAALDQPRATGQADWVRGEVRRRMQRRQRRRLAVGTSLLAVSCLALALWVGLPLPSGTMDSSSAPATARLLTPVRQVLPDGSVAELPTDGEITVAYSAGVRRVLLVRGEAFFDVKKDPARPFIVDAGSVTVRAVGTAFVVSRSAPEVEVVVTGGKVAVARPESGVAAGGPEKDASALVAAGQRLFVPEAGGVLTTTSMNPRELERRLAWRRPRFEFTDTTLGEAVALFNHQGSSRLRVGDAATAGVRITGVFRADNAEAFVGLLEAGFSVRAERSAAGETVLRHEPDGS